MRKVPQPERDQSAYGRLAAPNPSTFRAQRRILIIELTEAFADANS